MRIMIKTMTMMIMSMRIMMKTMTIIVQGEEPCMAVINGKWHDTSCHNRLIIWIKMLIIVVIMMVMIKIFNRK